MLDIDSPLFNRFDEVDQFWLEKIRDAIVQEINWQATTNYTILEDV